MISNQLDRTQTSKLKLCKHSAKGLWPRYANSRQPSAFLFKSTISNVRYGHKLFP
ncbi:MAG: hypothetical protein F6K50_43870 [Moorea sp. SIO3I7]|uniref:hypothetical protein n=1 Tax=unclassified Moorena TaxID=2683338 RepID=UPI0013CD5052|nr:MULTISPECIES: hypothetical protein [unclassified Moorena]NEO02070.1 hypothetical protein [Moorena sp. SIO3I7]NEO12142.1 hypothetical protein [Moorena sp. SIO3E8]NEQ02442.1 hypothetical protein [Moorena sp. SIO3F7]